MPPSHAVPPLPNSPLTGTTREFAEFAKRERQRRRNIETEFDPELFDAAVEYILHKLATPSQETGA